MLTARVVLGAVVDGGLLAEARSSAFVAREKAIALIRHARECSLWREFVDDADGWRTVHALLRSLARDLGDGDEVITARQRCTNDEAQRACVAAFQAVVVARKARG